MKIIQLPKGFKTVGEVYNSKEFKDFVGSSSIARVNNIFTERKLIKGKSGRMFGILGINKNSSLLEQFCNFKKLTNTDQLNG